MKIRVILFFVFCAFALGCSNIWSADSPDIVDNNSQEFPSPIAEPELFSVAAPVPTEEIASVQLSGEQREYVQTGNDFSFRLLNLLHKESNKSLVFSPLSIQFALGMTVNGAKGNTANEIVAALGMGDNLTALNEYCKTLLEQLPATDLNVALKMADAMVLNDRFTVLPSYKERIETNFYAPVESISFDNPEEVKALINDWCSKNTEDLIPSILDDVNPLAVCYLMNALYFKGVWTIPFNDETVKMPFISGSTEKDLDYLTIELAREYAERDNYRIVSIPYGRKKDFVFYIILPKDNDGLAEVLDAMTLREWTEALKSMRKDSLLKICVPEFSTESKYSLNKVLKSIGIKDAFVNGIADFSGMVQDQNLYISDVIHKAKLSIDKTGTEGAAVTANEMCGATGPSEVSPVTPIEFIADHPFAYVIAERSSGAILFSGTFDGE